MHKLFMWKLLSHLLVIFGVAFNWFPEIGDYSIKTDLRNIREQNASVSISYSQPTISQPGIEQNRVSNIQIIEANDQYLIVEVNTPLPLTRSVELMEGKCDQLTVEGYSKSTQPGFPQLPEKGILIGIPIYSMPTLIDLDSAELILPEKFNLCPVETPITKIDLNGELIFEGYKLIKDPLAYLNNRNANDSNVVLDSIGYIRSQRVAQLIIKPFQYDPVTGKVMYFPRLRFRLDFNTRLEDINSVDSDPESGDFETILEHSLLNYSQSRSWRASPQYTNNRAINIEDEDILFYKIYVEEDGLYQLTYQDLISANIPQETIDSLDPRTIKITAQGIEIALFIPGEDDGSFDPGDVILFIGQKMDSKYTNTNVYWLSWGVSYGLRMTERDSSPSGSAEIPEYYKKTSHYEEDHSYLSSLSSGPENDHWYWGFIFASGTSASKDFSFPVTSVVDTPITATLRGVFNGYSASPQHHTKVYLNDNLIDNAFWPSISEYNFEINIPHSYLVEGTNTITVECPLDYGITEDVTYINYFELDYLAAFNATEDQLFFNLDTPGTWELRVAGFSTDTVNLFDISDPVHPTIINGIETSLEGSTYTIAFEESLTLGRNYLAIGTENRISPVDIVQDIPSILKSGSNSADYLIISHADLIIEAQRLVDYRETQGFLGQVIDVQDIFDEFSGGVFFPPAIRDFLANAYTNWTPPVPVYVTLFGDGHYDFKDNFGRGEINYVPPFMVDIDPWIGETAADNRYVSVSGTDFLPDMHLGRLPVKSEAEANLLVDKIINYESAPSINEWSKKIVFVADDADDAGDFASISDSIASEFLPSPFISEKIYYGYPPYESAIDTKSAIINGINDGRLLINYIGHGAIAFWAEENLFNISDIPSLQNMSTLPLMIPMTCMDGYFVRPSDASFNRSSLGESIVASTPHGAIASWSPTGYGVATGHDFLNKGLFEALFTDDVIQLGPATTLAKLYLAANSTLHNDLLDTYILFGDPATQLNVPPAEVSISKTVFPTGVLDPGDQITYTLTFTNTGIATAHHVVVTDQLPTMLLNPVINSSGVSVTQRLGSAFIWDVEDIEPGETGVITITATIDPEFFGSIANTASINTSARELDRLNNTSAPVMTLVQRPTSTLLGSFTATSYPGSILLQWETTSEVDLAGFNLYRADSPNGLLVKVNPDVIAPETPGSGVGNDYIFYDSDIVSGLTYYYWIELITNRDTYINGPISEFADYYLHAPLLKH